MVSVDPRIRHPVELPDQLDRQGLPTRCLAIPDEPMRLHIPTLGDELVLSSDWTFTLHKEYRNSGFIDTVLGISSDDWEAYWKVINKLGDSITVTLPAGSVLKVDRVFIRKGAGDYDSLSFWLMDCPHKAWASKKVGGTAKGRLRFWVKLDDANKIEFVS